MQHRWLNKSKITYEEAVHFEEGVDNVHDLIHGEFGSLLIPVRDKILESVIEVLSVDAILQFAGAIILKRVY